MASFNRSSSGFSAKAFLFLILLIIGALGLYIVRVKIPELAKDRVETILQTTGFSHVEVGKIKLSIAGLIAKDIKLDEFGFDKIETLTARFNWLPFIIKGEVEQVAVDGLSIGRDSANLGPSMRQLGSNLLNIPPYQIDITKAVIDLGTAYGEIRITADASVTPFSESGPRQLKALIKSEQFQLGFDSDWQGTIASDGALDLSGKVDSGRINVGPLRISRYNGWVTLSSNQAGLSGQAQMEAGAATFMEMPLEKLSLVADYGGNGNSVFFRSGVSGMRDIIFTADYTAADGKSSFSSLLKGRNLGSFLDYIEEATKHEKTIRGPLLSADPFAVAFTYQPDRGFVGGPLPFTVTLSQKDEKKLDGNLLFYSDTLDVRGALETNPEMASALQEYFKIPPENVNQNFIRLDGGAQRFFMFGGKDSITGDALAGTNNTPQQPDAAAPASQEQQTDPLAPTLPGPSAVTTTSPLPMETATPNDVPAPVGEPLPTMTDPVSAPTPDATAPVTPRPVQ